MRHNFFSLKSPWGHPDPPWLTPEGAWARFSVGKFSLEGAAKYFIHGTGVEEALWAGSFPTWASEVQSVLRLL